MELTDKKRSDDECRCWTIRVQQLGYDDVSDDPAETGCYHRNRNTCSSQTRGEYLGYETVESCVTAADDATEECGDYQVLGLVVDKVQSDRAETRGECTEDWKWKIFSFSLLYIYNLDDYGKQLITYYQRFTLKSLISIFFVNKIGLHRKKYKNCFYLHLNKLTSNITSKVNEELVDCKCSIKDIISRKRIKR